MHFNNDADLYRVIGTNIKHYREQAKLTQLQLAEQASMMEYLRKNLFRFMVRQKQLTITKIISDKQISLENKEIDLFIS